ncbi:MAG: glycolate oxidase subunit GlcF [Gammaproteobacteria bacterium]|jgi:glycolate oxidase iron-sulfur subunit|uniref:glycolate oxidase subunit GlcF n=1 Tax=Parahaliea mediterranea TaxID=651086 RepID=UPI000E2FD284|nr:glycolate oxidase subunit GlcF [Parahaliea mediterranea]MBK6585548.1 glycolate oxidase subunit GlcF [Gammaproteobacteria bacterium]
MKTDITEKYSQSEWALEAAHIIESCVHCGFCNATCPTYLELGDERDGPRGRIYLVKQLLEEGDATSNTVRHLDRCLTCRSCETTCPSSVEYGRLADLARHTLEQHVKRPLHERLSRWILLQVLPYRRRFGILLRIGQILQPLLPRVLAREVPARQKRLRVAEYSTTRSMIALSGCAQPAATPNTNLAAARVLGRLGIKLIEPDSAGCCGAANYHLSDHDKARMFARRNIDAWWPIIEQGAEAVVMSASGCGSLVKDYGKLLRDDPRYADKAKAVSTLAKDLSEVLLSEDLESLPIDAYNSRVAVHCPCSLQHGQNLPNAIPKILNSLGVETVESENDHLCCGSAGTYSLLQPQMSRRLRDSKLSSLNINKPDEILTANVGCQMHLGSAAEVPVKHWIELVDQIAK